MTELSNGRITLRRWETGDCASLVKYANNPKVAANLRDRFPHPYTLKDAEFWVSIASDKSPLMQFAIVFDGHAVGGIGLEPGVDIYRHSAEIGYWLGEPYWGKGIASDALALMTNYAFHTLNYHRLFAGVFVSNPASARVLEKTGYKQESCMRGSVLKNGQIFDQFLYVALKTSP